MQIALWKACACTLGRVLTDCPYILNFLLWKNKSDSSTLNITLAVCGASVLTACSLLECITFKEEPIVLRVLRMISSIERNVYAWPPPPHPHSPLSLCQMLRKFFLALFNFTAHFSLTYGALYVEEFKSPICICADDFSIDIWMHLL